MRWKWQSDGSGQGLLNSAQHLLWSASWPDAEPRKALLDVIEASHFRSVERYSLGVVRCRREAGQVTCRLFGWRRAPALVFVDAATQLREDVVVRAWTIAPGLMARYSATPDASYGTLTIGVERVPGTGESAVGLERLLGASGVRVDGAVEPKEKESGGTGVHAYARVEGFPSRFLWVPAGLWGRRLLRWHFVWGQVEAIYRTYHAWVSFGCLREIAALLGAKGGATAWRPLAPEDRPLVVLSRPGTVGGRRSTAAGGAAGAP